MRYHVLLVPMARRFGPGERLRLELSPGDSADGPAPRGRAPAPPDIAALNWISSASRLLLPLADTQK